MKVYAGNLFKELELALEKIHLETGLPLNHSAEALKCIIPIFEKLKTTAITNKFDNKADEITFFRDIKPQFAMKLIYSRTTISPTFFIQQLRKTIYIEE